LRGRTLGFQKAAPADRAHAAYVNVFPFACLILHCYGLACSANNQHTYIAGGQKRRGQRTVHAVYPCFIHPAQCPCNLRMGLQQGVQGYNYASCLKARGWCIQKICHCLEWNNNTLMRKGIYWLLNNYATFFFFARQYMEEDRKFWEACLASGYP
jgi:hypothetical protein